MNPSEAKTIDEYISSFPEDAQALLNELRNIIKSSAPEAKEKISYSMPAFHQEGNLVYFANCKNHIGLYPMPSAIVEFEKELKDYKCSKGAIQFPLDKPLPKALIQKIVKFRIKENLDLAKYKKEIAKEKLKNKKANTK